MANFSIKLNFPPFFIKNNARTPRVLPLINWLIVCLFFVLNSTTLFAQAPAQDTIRVTLKGYSHDSLWFGPAYGRSVQILIGAARGPDSQFVFPLPERIQDGMYGFISRKAAGARPEFHTCWLITNERSFDLETEVDAFYARAIVNGSEENKIYFQYMHQYAQAARRLAGATDNWKMLSNESTWKSLLRAEEQMYGFQSTFIQSNQDSRTAGLIAKSIFRLPPPTLQTPAERFGWYRDHFHDDLDLAAPDFLRYALWLDRLDFYLMMLPPPEPDTMIAMADDLFARIKDLNKSLYHYYGAYLIQVTEPISRFNLDHLYVHLVRQYALPGEIQGLSADRLEYLRLNADRLERIFTGKQAPNLSLKNRQGDNVSLYKLPAAWTLLVYWLPDCQVCEKELPEIKALWEKYQSRGLQVVSVCGRSGPGEPCWTKTDLLALPDAWHSWHDPERTSRFQSLYNVRSYPQIFLLDPERRIRYKQVGGAPSQVLEKAVMSLLP